MIWNENVNFHTTEFIKYVVNVFRYLLETELFFNLLLYRGVLQIATNITKCVLPFSFFPSQKFESINFRNGEKFQIHLFFQN